jgi:TonB family protein
MSHPPLPTPPWPGEPDSPSLSTSDRSGTEPDFAQHESVLEALREQVAAGEQDTEILLDAITVAAQFVTEASGAALGMRRAGAVLCVGRSGETAPELGAHVSEESGISGECLRTGRTLRCRDTETDPRVDADVCRALGIRSIAAVPVRSSDATVGVLEVFSTSAQAFTDEHIAFLSSLAGLVETACSNSEVPAKPPVRMIPGAEMSPALSPVEPPATSVFWAQAPWWQEPKWRYAMAGAVALVMLVSIVSWRVWRTPARIATAQPANTRPVGTPASEGIPAQTIAESLPKPDAGQMTVSGSNPSATKAPLVQASKIEIDDEPLVRRFNTTPPADANAGASPATPAEPANEAPPIQLLSPNNEALGGVASSVAAMPSLGVPVSKGVTPLVLERKVTPTYPAQALALRLEGAVVLQAFVNEHGRVEEITLVSGSPVLGKAAMEAVKEWRYRPALLNGKPVRTETRITINFQASTAR